MEICKAAGIGYETNPNNERKGLVRIRCGKCWVWFSKELTEDSAFGKCKSCRALNDCSHFIENPKNPGG